MLICTKPIYIVKEETLLDAWKGVVEKENKIVEGLYYHHHGLNQHSYMLMNATGPACILSHVVFATEATMTLASHKKMW